MSLLKMRKSAMPTCLGIWQFQYYFDYYEKRNLCFGGNNNWYLFSIMKFWWEKSWEKTKDLARVFPIHDTYFISYNDQIFSTLTLAIGTTLGREVAPPLFGDLMRLFTVFRKTRSLPASADHNPSKIIQSRSFKLLTWALTATLELEATFPMNFLFQVVVCVI